MIYMLKVYSLVVFAAFALTSILLLMLMIWSHAREYALARQAMRRIAKTVSHDPS